MPERNALTRVLEAIKSRPDSDGQAIRAAAGVSRARYNAAKHSLMVAGNIYESSRKPIKRSDGRTRTVPHFAPSGWRPDNSIEKVWR